VSDYCRKQEVAGYRRRKTLRRFIKVVSVNLLLLFLYLFNFERKKFNFISNALVPTNFRSLSERIVGGYNKSLCRRPVIEGVKFSNYDRIQRYVEQYCQEDNFSLKNLESALRNDPWVKNLYLHRNIASGLKITMVEYNPFALFTSDYVNYSLIDEFGTKINILTEELSDFSYLFTIVDNNFNADEVNRLFNILSAHWKIAKNISVFIRIGDRRWNLRLKNGVLIKMPEENDSIVKTWATLNTLLAIHDFAIGLEEIDLRVEGRVFMKYDSKTKAKIENFSRDLTFTRRFGIDNL
jgi:cell division protein FtsQ